MLSWFKKKSKDPKAQLKEILGKDELPTFKAVVMAILEKLRDPDASLGDIGDALTADPGLSVRVIRLVNSPAYGLRRPVANARRAVQLLGKSEVECVLLSVAVKDVMPSRPVAGYDPKAFWRHAAERACIAKEIAQLMHPATKSESFTAGLLQDMAVPLLASAREGYGSLLEHWRQSTENLVSLEQSEFSWNHAEVAGWLCETWKIPEALADAIGTHHEEEIDGESIPLAVSMVSLLPARPHEDISEIVETMHQRTGIPTDDAVAAIEAGLEAATELSSMFS